MYSKFAAGKNHPRPDPDAEYIAVDDDRWTIIVIATLYQTWVLEIVDYHDKHCTVHQNKLYATASTL